MSKLYKDSYVTNLITKALIDILREKELHEISISEITNKAHVSRCSFYRNYDAKEAIIRKYVYTRIRQWQQEFDNSAPPSMNGMWKSLFDFLKRDQDFYKLLQKRSLLYLVGEAIHEICGPQPEDSDETALFMAFVASGVYGWIEEWIKRGMKDELSDIMKKHIFDMSQI